MKGCYHYSILSSKSNFILAVGTDSLETPSEVTQESGPANYADTTSLGSPCLACIHLTLAASRAISAILDINDNLLWLGRRRWLHHHHWLRLHHHHRLGLHHHHWLLLNHHGLRSHVHFVSFIYLKL